MVHRSKMKKNFIIQKTANAQIKETSRRLGIPQTLIIEEAVKGLLAVDEEQRAEILFQKKEEKADVDQGV